MIKVDESVHSEVDESVPRWASFHKDKSHLQVPLTVHSTNLDVAASDENIDFFLTSSKRQAVTHMFLEAAMYRKVFGPDASTKKSERLVLSRTNK